MQNFETPQQFPNLSFLLINKQLKQNKAKIAPSILVPKFSEEAVAVQQTDYFNNQSLELLFARAGTSDFSKIPIDRSNPALHSNQISKDTFSENERLFLGLLGMGLVFAFYIQ